MIHLHLLMALQFIGIAAFAASGALVAGERQMDWFGVMVLGIIVAVGGGTLRDLLLDVPVFWIGQSWYIAVAAATALATIPLARWAQKVRRPVAIAEPAAFQAVTCCRDIRSTASQTRSSSGNRDSRRNFTHGCSPHEKQA